MIRGPGDGVLPIDTKAAPSRWNACDLSSAGGPTRRDPAPGSAAAGRAPDTYPRLVSDDDAVAVRLSRAEWRIVHEALDAYFYEVEHSNAGGIRSATRRRNEARRIELLKALPHVEAAIAAQAGLGPVLGDE